MSATLHLRRACVGALTASAIAIASQASLAAADETLPPPLHDDNTVFTIYVDPQGSDTASGASRAQAVRTLAQAQRLVQAGVSSTPRNVNILLAPGTYPDPCVEAGGTREGCSSGAAVRWSFTMPGHTIEFRPLDPTAPCPVFDGSGTRRSSWFWLRAARGQLTNIVITGVRVQHYWNAVGFAGSVTDAAGYNGGNILRNNVFADIGANPQMVPPGAENEDANRSFSAVGITNSRKNLVTGNTFLDIVTDYECPFLHALYIAHDSSYNAIVGNSFQRACGNPVRIRDHSNFNFVSDNTFVESGYNGYYEDWFSHTSECASFGNVFTENRLVSAFGGRVVPAAVLSRRPAATCNTVSRRAQVRAWGNHSFGGTLK